MKMFKIKQIASIAGFLIASGQLPADAQVTVSVDMDRNTPGIQDTISAFGGAALTVGIIMDVGAGGVSSYGISLGFDNSELQLNGSPAATELLPAGFSFNLTAGVASENNATGEVRTFEAATFGSGPSSSTFEIGTVDFTVNSAVDDGAADIVLGLFNTGVDGIFDNVGSSVTATFNPGFVIPEPNTGLLCGLGLLTAFAVRRLKTG